MTAIRAIRRRLRPVRRLARAANRQLLEFTYRLEPERSGSAIWLIRAEARYGGFVDDVAWRRASPQGPAFISHMTGGDRMSLAHHGYAPIYARYLAPFIGARNLTIAEFGILKGTGLAIWCDLFEDARVMGFDIDLGHFEENREALVQRGAFQANQPSLHEYDQFVCGRQRLSQILGGDRLDIVMDDGYHSVKSIATTWRSVEPFLAPRFVYFIEDHAGLLKSCGDHFSGYACRAFGEMTVVSRGLSID